MMRSAQKRWSVGLIIALLTVSPAHVAAQSRSGGETAAAALYTDDGDLQFAYELFSPEELEEALQAVPVDEDGNPIELSPEELADLPSRIREVLLTPVRNDTAIGGIEEPGDPHIAWYAAPSGRHHWTGGWHNEQLCASPEYSQQYKNALGFVLATATIQFQEICTSGGDFVGTPGVKYSANAHWGFTFCGWDGQYDRRSNARAPRFPAFTAGGEAKFSVAVAGVANLCDNVSRRISVKLWAYTFERGAWMKYFYWRNDALHSSFSFG